MPEPSSTRVDARALRTRRTLLDALLRLIEVRAFERITIREIAGEAGIGYATFFRHYPSKEALLHDLAAAEIAALLQRAVPILFAQDSRGSCAILFDDVARHRSLWTALLTGGAAATMKQAFVDQAKRIADARGPAGGSIPDELRIAVAVAATIEMIAWWLACETPEPVSRMAEMLDRLVVTPAIAAG